MLNASFYSRAQGQHWTIARHGVPLSAQEFEVDKRATARRGAFSAFRCSVNAGIADAQRLNTALRRWSTCWPIEWYCHYRSAKGLWMPVLHRECKNICDDLHSFKKCDSSHFFYLLYIKTWNMITCKLPLTWQWKGLKAEDNNKLLITGGTNSWNKTVNIKLCDINVQLQKLKNQDD